MPIKQRVLDAWLVLTGKAQIERPKLQLVVNGSFITSGPGWSWSAPGSGGPGTSVRV